MYKEYLHGAQLRSLQDRAALIYSAREIGADEALANPVRSGRKQP